jgi:hypothetical protein
MAGPTDRARANMEVVLEETCRSLPHGGEHAVRAFIAQRLGEAVESGRTTIGQLTAIARKAFTDYQKQPNNLEGW